MEDHRNSATRGQFLKGAACVAAAGAAAMWLPPRRPRPIPWLDPNLHHNQVPEPGGFLSGLFGLK